MIIQKIKEFGKRLLLTETSVNKLALSTSLGIFVAFSPFVFLHTVMAIVLSWLLSFNVGVTLVVSTFIHNPLTMAPIYACDYAFGKMLSLVCNLDILSRAPHFLASFCELMSGYIGLPSHSIWTFFIGGNLLSTLLAVGMYWPSKWFFEKYHTHRI